MFQKFLKQVNSQVSQKGAHSFATDRTSIPETSGSVEQALQDQIVALWKDIWQGLYQFHDRKGTYHVDRLKEHYFAAGMSASHIIESPDDSLLRLDRSHGVLGLLALPLSQQGPRRLRLFDGLSVSSLESVVTLLEAYRRQIPAMDEIYVILRRLEVDCRTPTTDDEKAVEQQYLPLADVLAKQLLHLDARLAILVSRLSDENWETHGASPEHNGWLVYERVYPRQHGRAQSAFSRC
ncbi:hypothetical protein V501_00711 [Pseudogymnoascus sp. VKM F-4519 (FW-2642)]|nr:hypothetical protein V501_00711 [Pseudogymnoascus sp. VKM F-4519 (FW-2642)]